MAKFSVTYHAPDGDDEVTKVFGFRFVDGDPVEIDDEEHPFAMSKLVNNQHFEVGEPKAKRGRPAKKLGEPTFDDDEGEAA